MRNKWLMILAFLIPCSAHSAIQCAGSTEAVASTYDFSGATKFTLMAWMKRTAANDYVAMSQSKTDGNTMVLLNFWTDGNISASIVDGSANFGYFYGVNDDQWHHAALVFNGAGAANEDRMKIYVDGSLKTLTFSGTIEAAATTMDQRFQLCYRDNNDLMSTGQIDDVAIYDRVLTDSEIETLAKSRLHNFITDGRVAYWPLDHGVDGVSTVGVPAIGDRSGNGYHMTVKAGKQPATWRPSTAIGYR